MFSLLLVLAATAPSQTATPATSEATQSRGERKVCKRESVTGSLARVRKVCKTVDQWESDRSSAVKESQDMQDRGLINSEAPR
jgi:predicted secreted protein